MELQPPWVMGPVSFARGPVCLLKMPGEQALIRATGEGRCCGKRRPCIALGCRGSGSTPSATVATLLFAEGCNAVQVQRWLGHHSPAFTLSVYVHLLDGDLGAPLSVLEGANEVQTEPTPLDARATVAAPTEIAVWPRIPVSKHSTTVRRRPHNR
jgi:hypothetical protein